MDKESSLPLLRIRFKDFWPYLVFGGLVLILLLSSTLNNRPPEVDEIHPLVAVPGDELVITGRFFGSSRNGGRVVVSNVSPPSSAYLEWTNRRISLIVPEEMRGGLLKIVTKHGESREVIPFTNKRYLPVVLAGPLKPGEPYITSFEPKSGSVGTPVSIKGLNFGLKRGSSTVSFAWISGDGQRTIDSSEDPDILNALENDYDYVAWNDREIVVRVPDGASSGKLRIMTDKGVSNAVYFEVKDYVGSKLFTNRRIYHVQNTIEIKDVNADEGNSLYLWVPRIVEGAEQRDVKVVSADPAPMFDDYRGTTLFFLENLLRGERYSVSIDMIFSRYEVVTKVIPGRVTPIYDKTSRLYHTYTSSDALVPASDKTIISVAHSVVGTTKNPYTKAWLLYSYVLNRLSYVEAPENYSVPGVLSSKKGNAYLYSMLFCSLARAVGVPARPVAGYVVVGKNQCRRHYWAEFYLEKLGWVPVDPLLGDGVKLGDLKAGVNLQQYYFGSLDNMHIALSKGLIDLKQMNPKGRLVTRRNAASFQTIHEEYAGNLRSYSSQWSQLELLGTY
jgi:hypothetical protein